MKLDSTKKIFENRPRLRRAIWALLALAFTYEMGSLIWVLAMVRAHGVGFVQFWKLYFDYWF